MNTKRLKLRAQRIEIMVNVLAHSNLMTLAN
jgi:hypothetical protein